MLLIPLILWIESSITHLEIRKERSVSSTGDSKDCIHWAADWGDECAELERFYS